MVSVGRKSRARALGVWINGLHVADWRMPSRGDTEVQYSQPWVDAEEGRPLSLSLPFNLENAPVRGDPVRFYFDNLLPDSEAIRTRIQARYRTESKDPFALLAAIGRDCVGAVQLLPDGETPVDVHAISAEPLSDEEIDRALKLVISPATPGGLEDDDFRISIAGAQEKSAFLWHENRWCRPHGSTPTSHIFKLPLGLVGGVQADMRESVENEWLCAKILKLYGLPVADCDIANFGSQKVLVVRRFDRQLHHSGKYWLRLVQEDFCQALALPHTKKYESEGGPGILQIAEILGNSSTRDADLETFFASQVLFWLLAAGDGHAKNFSLRILAGGSYELAPLYDVLSYWPILGHEPNKLSYQKARVAMALLGKNRHYRLAEIQLRHFRDTGARMGLGKRATEIISNIATQTPGVLDQVQKQLPAGFPQSILEPILEGIKEHVSKLSG